MTLGIELPFISGRMDVANLGLAIVDERTPFRLAAALLVCGWSLLAFRVASGIYLSIRMPLVRHWLVGVLTVLVAGLFVPALLRQQLIDRLALGFGLRLADPDAFGHALVFGLLALLVRIGRPRVPLLVHLSCWLLVGAVVEVLQLFTPDRSPEAGDWLIGAIGTCVGPGGRRDRPVGPASAGADQKGGAPATAHVRAPGLGARQPRRSCARRPPKPRAPLQR